MLHCANLPINTHLMILKSLPVTLSSFVPQEFQVSSALAGSCDKNMITAKSLNNGQFRIYSYEEVVLFKYIAMVYCRN